MSSTWAVRGAGGVIAVAALAVAIAVSWSSPTGATPGYATPALGALALAVTALAWLARAPRAVQVVGAITVLAFAAAHALRAGAVANDTGACVVFALSLLIALRQEEGAIAIIEDRGVPSLRSLAVATPVGVVAQIALGAAYRHELVSAIPHVAWAFAAILLVLMTGTFVVTSASGASHRALRSWAIVLMSLVCVQLVFGVAAFLGRLSPETFSSPALATILRTLHLATGALLAATSALVGDGILRHARRAGAVDSAQFAGNGPRA